MLSVEINRDELEEYQKILAQWGEATNEAIGEAMAEVLHNIVNRSKQYSPVDTGHLKRSIRLTRFDKKKLEGVVDTHDVEYALIVHETHKTKRHFILRAINNSEADAQARIAQRIELINKRGL